MSDPFQIEPVSGKRRGEALCFLGAGRRRDLQAALQGEALGDVLTRAGAKGHFWLARRGEEIVAAAMVIPSPGRVGMVFHSPAESPGVEASPLAGALRLATDGALADGLAFAQSLIGIERRADAGVLVEGGFQRLAELMYMQRDLARPIDPPDVSELSWQSCKSISPAELCRVIAGTYEHSLDCPVLAELRGADDSLESHKASGIWRPDFWWIAKLCGAPAGCVLVNDSASNPGDMDLIYMGVGAQFRGRGLGRQMVLLAMQQAKAARRQFMHVVVDASNPYARKMYEKEGFVLTNRRLAYIRRRYHQ